MIFQKKLMTITLLKALTAAGMGSRRTVAQAVKDGRVLLNGQLAASFSQPVTSEDKIIFNGELIALPAKKEVYLLLNKPRGVLSTTYDARSRKTVIDFVPTEYRVPGLHLIGRLDLASRGLVVLTSDGNLTYHLTHPSFEKEREYLVELNHVLTPADKIRFEQGVELEDGPTHPANLADVSLKPPIYRVVLHEGRKRQIRRMFQSLGYAVCDLKRTRLGGLRLGTLQEGEARELTDSEIAKLGK